MQKRVSSFEHNNKYNYNNQHSYPLRIELWKFLNLWVFGGLYVDLGLSPLKFTPSTIKNDDDGLFVIDSDTGLLSTTIMAVSPHHPIIYYAVQHLILNIMMVESSSSPSLSNNNNTLTGSFVLTQAFHTFQQKQQKRQHKVQGDLSFLSPGLFHGAMNRSTRVIADGFNNEDSNLALVMSIFSSQQEKQIEFQKMGMIRAVNETTTKNNNERRGFSCLHALYKNHHTHT